MKEIFEITEWMLRPADAQEGCDPAVCFTAPGSLYSALLDAGKMEDPYYRDNEMQSTGLCDRDYRFVSQFDAPEALFSCTRVILRFDGIDTLAEISLNGTALGSCNNMHRIWEFDVTPLLQPQENRLEVLFRSPTEFIRKAHQTKLAKIVRESMDGAPALRKAHCMFGWDWGARLPDMGFFRPVQLVGIRGERIDSVLVQQFHEADGVRLTFDVQADAGTPVSARSRDWVNGCFGGTYSAQRYRVILEAPDGTQCVYEDSPRELTVRSPQLWWPNGLGEQNLYTVTVELLSGNGTEAVDRWTRRIGLRTLTMRREKDEFGECFCHEVNGVRFFAMGADYIPEDHILTHRSPDRTRYLLESAVQAHHNMIRVWGGGLFPEDYFYDLCDELGLVVWQDFMFACAIYDLSKEFEENITAEVIDNVTRLRHHASLGLWCGNNEMESFVAPHPEQWCTTPKYYADYVNMYEYLFPKLVEKLSPQVFYWPSSPSSGGAFHKPDDPTMGDVHYWEVWHGNKPFTEYRKHTFRYLSEFGFQSFPALKTVERFTEPEDRNVFSYVMEKHQRSGTGNGKIMNYMEQNYLYPTTFDALLYASQLLQAEGIRYGVEHFRRNRGCCMGTCVWQLNDNWPVASWASIDYFGRWKALHYAEKRFFAPLLLSCEEEGPLTQDPDVNAQPYDMKKSIRLCASNETRETHRVTVEWELRDPKAAVLRSETTEMELPPLSSTWLEKTDLPEVSLRHHYVSYRMKNEAGEVVSEGTTMFGTCKYFFFEKPQLTVRVEGDEIIVSADVYARAVRIQNEDDNLILSDNFFDLNAEEKRIKIISGNPEGLKVSSVYDIR